MQNLKRFERWLDDLTEEQTDQIRTTAHNMENNAASMLEMRIQWQRELLRLLDERAGQSNVHQAIVNLFVQRDALRSEAYQQQLEHNQELVYRLIADISKTLEAEQKDYLNSRIDKYIDLFTSLIKDGQEESVLREAKTE